MITYIGFNNPFWSPGDRPSATVTLSKLEKVPDIVRYVFTMLNLKDGFNMCVASRAFCHIIYQAHFQLVPYLLQKFNRIPLRIPLFKRVEWSGFVPNMPLHISDNKNNPIVEAIPPNVLSIVSDTMTDGELRFLPPNLKSLDLSRIYYDWNTMYWSLITDEGLSNLPRHLNVLDLSGTMITGKVLGALPVSLTALNLDYCDNIGRKWFKNLPPGLLCLHLVRCNITDEEIRELPRGLQKLSLRRTKITDAGLKDLPSDLEYLDLADCEKITDKGLEDLPTNLRFLDLNGCTITPETPEEFSKWLPAKLSKCCIEALGCRWNGRNRIYRTDFTQKKSDHDFP